MPKALLNGIEINYEAHGPEYAAEHGSRAPIVLTHGYSASLEMWRDQLPQLAGQHRVVVYDTRGHGGTTAPGDMKAYSLARDYVADLTALLDHLGIARAHIGGLSMGGMIAQEFALQHPERVTSLLLFDTGPGMGALGRSPALRARFEAMRGMMQKLARTQGMDSVIDAMRNSPMAQARGNGPVPESVRRHVANMRKMNVDGYLGGAAAMQEWDGAIERLHRITVPTLVLVGEQDQLLEPSRVIHAKIPHSRFVLIRESGHGSNMWQPERFISATLDFLADMEAGRPTDGEFVLG